MLAYMEALEKSKQETIDLIEELENEKNEDMAAAETMIPSVMVVLCVDAKRRMSLDVWLR